MLGTLTVENDTIHWLVNRQIDGEKDKGGFNGRVNKPGDTCYSFWAGGALDILGGIKYTSAEWIAGIFSHILNILDLVDSAKSRNNILTPSTPVSVWQV